MIAHLDVTSSPAHDTPTTAEVVAHSISELEALLARPRTEGEPLHVRLEGPAAQQVFGVGVAVTVSATVTEEVAA
ncbi:hypothetical protein ABFV47_27230 [Mycolicibacterium fortuitum]|uniref:hypothetical protein n=1 Tax=Mycolicibacterium fortuitum TaxID=1766 RepID=UPI0007EB1551|nr:hypothetical protein [Mycolicibacterium fortuitum]OBG09533.1 hypothetical protein A5768_15240 [Mycolicibacterium fortuitum]